MFSHDTTLEKALRFSRFDGEHLLSTVSDHCFELEEEVWPSAEHYYQTRKFEGLAYAETVRAAATPQEAHKLGNKWLKKKRKDFDQVRKVLMTRALYSKAVQNEAVQEFLLSTEDELLIEISLYGHYWGIGRDQRGENVMGHIWMDIRKKIREDLASK